MRLLLPLGTMFVAALLLGAVSLQLFAPDQLVEENEPPARAAKAVAEALNSALLMSPNPQQTLDAFVKSLGTSEAIRFQRAGTERPAHCRCKVRTPLGRVPHWFVDLLGLPEIGASFSVTSRGNRSGTLYSRPTFRPKSTKSGSAFLRSCRPGIALMLLTGTIAYFTAGTVVQALRNLGDGLTRMRRAITNA